MEEDPLKTIVRMSNLVGHISVRLKHERYIASNRRALVANIVTLLVLQMMFEYNTYTSWNQIVAAYGLWMVTLIQLDVYLTFGLNYLMVLNGAVQSKNFVKLLNRMRRIIQKSHFAKTRYKRLWRITSAATLLNVVLNFGIHCAYPWFSNLITTKDELIREILLSFLVTFGDTFYIFFNAVLTVLQIEFIYIKTYLVDTNANQLEQAKLLRRTYNDAVLVMNLVTKCFALPIVYSALLLSFEGTVQLFQFFLLLRSEHKSRHDLKEMLYYLLWFVPYVVKFFVTINMANSTSEKVSGKHLFTACQSKQLSRHLNN